MKALLIVVGVLSMQGFVTTAQETQKVVVLKVSGMSCGECAKTVEKEVRKIDGVKAAKVSQPKGEAEIVYDPAKTAPAAIAKRISEKTRFKVELPKDPGKK